MFANFDKAFKKNPLKTKIPQEVLNTISKQLPKGFRYVDIGNGACRIDADRINIKVPLKIPEFAMKYKEQIKTTNDLLKYLYRTQQPLEITPHDDNCIIINNRKINIKDIIKFPLNEKDIADICTFHIIPHELPSAFPVLFKAGDIEKSFMMKQQPYDSMTEVLFKSELDGCMQISYIVNEVEPNFTININTKVENAKSIKDIIEAFEFYNSFCDGDIKIFGHQIGQVFGNLPNKISIKAIEFWKKAAALEKELNISFNPTVPLTEDDVLSVDQLYRSIVMNKPYKEYVKFESVKGTGFKAKSEMDKIIGTNMCFQFLQNYTWNLLDVKFNLTALVIIYDAEIVDYKIDENNKESTFRIDLKPIGDKGTYSVTQFLKTYDEARQLQQEGKEIIERFRDAEEIVLGQIL